MLLDLHCHLEGCVRPQTAAELAAEAGVPAPPQGWEAALRMTEAADLTVFLAHVAAAYPVLRRPEALERVACEAVGDAAADGCDYLELRCGPATHAGDGLPVEEALRAICRGAREGTRRSGLPCGVIACALRHHDAATNMAVARAAAALAGDGVVGFDVAGDELLFPSLEPFRDAFAAAAAAGLGLTAHVAEAGPADAVVFATEVLGARRIGHGFRVATSPEILSWSSAQGLTFEVCPTSNVMTGAVATLAAHPLRAFLDAGCGVVLGDDDPITTGSGIGNEARLLHDEVGLTQDELDAIAHRSVEVAFCTEAERSELRARLASRSAA